MNSCTVSEFEARMAEECDDPDAVYSPKWIRQLLKDRYDKHIFFAPITCKNDVVCFREKVSNIINEKW